MERKRASEIFGSVDPKLHVINGGQRNTGRKGKVREWNQAGGALCPRCGLEAVRFRPRDGLCLQCVRDIEENQEADEKKRARQLKFISQHNARITKRRAPRISRDS